MNFTDINHFHSLFSLGATHQWMVLTPAVRSGGDQIINGKVPSGSSDAERDRHE